MTLRVVSSVQPRDIAVLKSADRRLLLLRLLTSIADVADGGVDVHGPGLGQAALRAALEAEVTLHCG